MGGLSGHKCLPMPLALKNNCSSQLVFGPLNFNTFGKSLFPGQVYLFAHPGMAACREGRAQGYISLILMGGLGERHCLSLAGGKEALVFVIMEVAKAMQDLERKGGKAVSAILVLCW